MDVRVGKDGIILANQHGLELLRPLDVHELIHGLQRALFDLHNLNRKEKTE